MSAMTEITIRPFEVHVPDEGPSRTSGAHCRGRRWPSSELAPQRGVAQLCRLGIPQTSAEAAPASGLVRSAGGAPRGESRKGENCPTPDSAMPLPIPSLLRSGKPRATRDGEPRGSHCLRTTRRGPTPQGGRGSGEATSARPRLEKAGIIDGRSMKDVGSGPSDARTGKPRAARPDGVASSGPR
jgi:hypothetical protein